MDNTLGSGTQLIHSLYTDSPVAVQENKISRKRIIELQRLAVEAVAWAEAEGLKRGEQCMFREMCERLWWAD
jgi:hypothetical protein